MAQIKNKIIQVGGTQKVIFDLDCYFAKLNHYNGYSVNNDLLIFDIKEMGTDTWDVDFYEKKSDEKEYDTIGCFFATVGKQKYSSYIGLIIHSSPCIPIRETYLISTKEVERLYNNCSIFLQIM